MVSEPAHVLVGFKGKAGVGNLVASPLQDPGFRRESIWRLYSLVARIAAMPDEVAGPDEAIRLRVTEGESSSQQNWRFDIEFKHFSTSPCNNMHTYTRANI